MMRRLTDRTDNDFGKKPEEVQLMLALNHRGEKPAGSIDIDAERPLKEVVDENLELLRAGALRGQLGSMSVPNLYTVIAEKPQWCGIADVVPRRKKSGRSSLLVLLYDS